MTSDEKLRELGEELPWERPSDERREALRTSLLRAAEELAPERPRSKGWRTGAAFTSGVVAAAAVAALLVRRGDDEAISHAQVVASPAAEIEHTVTSTPTGTDEVILVHTGTVAIATPPVHGRGRSRAVTRDAQVEGVGAYEVTVAHDALAKVIVRSGAVTVSVRGHERAVFLSAGETWQATPVVSELAVTPDAAPSSGDAASLAKHGAPAAPPAVRAVAPARAGAPIAEPVRRREPAVAAVPARPEAGPRAAPVLPRIDPPASAQIARPQSATERHFQAGWTLLRANKAREAAVELAAAADAGSGGDALALDARYFQAVALVASAQPDAAERALAAFLDRAPGSLRRGRASVMLGRLLAARGEQTRARAWFTAALDDPDREVAAAARAALASPP